MKTVAYKKRVWEYIISKREDVQISPSVLDTIDRLVSDLIKKTIKNDGVKGVRIVEFPFRMKSEPIVLALINKNRLQELSDKVLAGTPSANKIIGDGWYRDLNVYIKLALDQTLTDNSQSARLTALSLPVFKKPKKSDDSCVGERTHQVVKYEVYTFFEGEEGMVVSIKGSTRIFTANSEKKIQAWLLKSISQAFERWGLPKVQAVNIISIE
jgi:hypothetical protein